jgi:hypothetical protein
VGLLHDVGKLQVGWQAWAERAQRSLDPAYVHAEPLAHTDYSREDPVDRERERAVNAQGRRPPHAAASAWYSGAAVVTLLSQSGKPATAELRAACFAAMIGHHGGWLPRSAGDDLGIQPLVSGADAALDDAAGSENLASLRSPRTRLSVRDGLDALLGPAVAAEPWSTWWPVVAYLTRTLRLADQRATSLYGGEE